MIRIAATIVCLFLAATATAARGAWQRVLDISTAATCRDAAGIAFCESTGTFWAVYGNTVLQFGGADRPVRVVKLDEAVEPEFAGIESLAGGNLLLVSAQTRRLYEITPAGRTIATKMLADRVMPRDVAYCPHRNRVYVLDAADQSVKEYSTADDPEAFYKIRLPDACALVAPHPGVLWVLDGQQRKVYSYRPGGELAELIDLTQVCNYEGPRGLAWDRSRGTLYVYFAPSQRIVGVVDAGAGIPERTEPTLSLRAPWAADRTYRGVHLPPQSGTPATGPSHPAGDSTAEALPSPEGTEAPATGQASRSSIEVPSPYPGLTIVVKPPYPPTIYVLPLIVRGDPIPPNTPRGLAPHGCCGPASLAGKPDLTVSNLEVLSLSGGRITFRYLVSNLSAVPVHLDGVIVHVLASADHVRNADDKLVGDHVFYGEVLGPRQSRCVSDTGVLRQGFQGRPFLIVELDTADRLAESNEENNTTVTLMTFAR